MVVCLKLISGSFWAFGIGTAAGIAATLDPNATVFHTTMDQLNFYLRERKLPKAMRMMCREYFTNAREVHQVNDDSSLLGQMTPKLLSIVAIAANKRWLDHVWFLRDLGSTGEEQEFIAQFLVMLGTVGTNFDFVLELMGEPEQKLITTLISRLDKVDTKALKDIYKF